MTSLITTNSNALFTTYIDPNYAMGRKIVALRNLIDTCGIEIFCQHLNVVGITSLDLSEYRNLSEQQVQALSTSIRVNVIFTELNLHSCEVRGLGMKILYQGLIMNQNLTKLDLGLNKLGDLGARLIGEVLEKNKKLTYLNLKDNCIGIAGGQAIGHALTINSTLQILKLSQNQLECPGALAIMDGLKNNTTLTELDLRENGIENHCRPSIALKIVENVSLRLFNGFPMDLNDRQDLINFLSTDPMET